VSVPHEGPPRWTWVTLTDAYGRPDPGGDGGFTLDPEWLEEHDERVRAEALREAAAELAMRIGRSDGTPAWLRARADTEEGK
jgi:hypothetical protein